MMERTVRTIKFRAWDSQSGKMIFLNSLTFDKYGKPSMLFDHYSEDKLQAIVSFGKWGGKNDALMQYTGHKSIDNQDIYEGDLMKFPSDVTIYEVKWDDDEGAWGIFYKSYNVFKIGMTAQLQLVGNIYENGDLLK